MNLKSHFDPAVAANGTFDCGYCAAIGAANEMPVAAIAADASLIGKCFRITSESTVKYFSLLGFYSRIAAQTATYDDFPAAHAPRALKHWETFARLRAIAIELREHAVDGLPAPSPGTGPVQSVSRCTTTFATASECIGFFVKNPQETTP